MKHQNVEIINRLWLPVFASAPSWRVAGDFWYRSDTETLWYQDWSWPVEVTIGGGGGGMTIGDAVSGGTASRLLYIDTSGDLADNVNLQFVDYDWSWTVNTLRVPKIRGKASTGAWVPMFIIGGEAASGSGLAGGTLQLAGWAGDWGWAGGSLQLWAWYNSTEVQIQGPSATSYFDTALVTSDRTFAFPNQDGKFLLYKTITLTGTQITGMGTTSGISLISAVSGKTICPVWFWAKATNGTVYTGATNTTWRLNYSATASATDDPFATSTIAPATYTSSGFLIQMTLGGIQWTNKYENTALYLTTSFQWGGGHSSNTVEIVIAYHLL